MKTTYVAYHSDKNGFALLSLPESVGNIRAVLGKVNSKEVDFVRMKAKAFDDMFLKADGIDQFDAVTRMLTKKPPITKSALERIEAMFDTRGKSTEQIRAEVLNLANDLPEDHPLRAVPKSFPDRGQAIAAYTTMRQAIFNLKEKAMSMQESTETKKRGRKAKSNGGDPAPAKAKKATKQEVPAKAKKATAKEDAPVAKKKVKKEKPLNEVRAAIAAALASKEKVNTTGPFKLGNTAIVAKSLEALPVQKGSSRQALMAYMFNTKKKSVTKEDLEEALGDQADQLPQALSGCLRYGFLQSA